MVGAGQGGRFRGWRTRYDLLVTDDATPLSRSERAALADLLAELGPDQPTRCEGWRTAELATHLVIRDRRPDAMPGMLLGGPFARWTDRVMTRTELETPWPELVEKVRSGPPAFVPSAWPPVDALMNGAEMAIHHEDVRRAQPDWSPRTLPRTAQDQLWKQVPFMARTGQSGLTGGLEVHRTDTGASKTLRSGQPLTTVAGEPLEVLLWASGREDVANVEVTQA